VDSDKRNFNDYMDRFEARLAAYIPPRDAWTPVEEALHAPRDLFRLPVAQAEALQLKAIRFAFEHHYTRNAMYRKFCAGTGVSPADIDSVEDLDRIPLIPDRFFKDYPEGKDFAIWLGNICTGDLPEVLIKSQTPTFDEVVSAFKAAGMVVTYSSGTGGRHTVIPRDRRTYLAAQYAAAKTAATMLYPTWNYDGHGCLLMPNPDKTDIFAGKVASVYFDAVRHVHTAIDRQVSARQMRMMMSEQKGLRSTLVRFIARVASLRLVDKIIRWLELHRKSGGKIILVGPPFLIVSVMNRLQERGRSLELGGRAVVITGGGWKMYEDERIPAAAFRQQVQDVLGVPGNHCLDVYGMVEGNGWMVNCPEGHHLHIPHSFFKPLVLDDEFKPLGYGQAGRFAFLDAAALSYPGFIITGDMVRLRERCPVCDRPGPVLEPEVQRAAGEDLRGCAEEVRHMVAMDVGG
jgi:phenylacetate-coenzyme A ligase PaaK-like adenylate-forming protein